MEFFNGLGGFTNDGREYLTILEGNDRTPAPWVNIVANPSFGFQVSTDGSGFTWSVNSQQNQLTPWSNDPVGDAPGEAIYVRDEETGEVWGPTALPIREKTATYSARHGQGYSQFEHDSHGIALELLQYVPIDDPIKISRLKIANHSGRDAASFRHGLCRMGAGPQPSATAPFVVTEIDPETGAIFAQNPWNEQFRRARGVRRPERPANSVDLRPDGIPRPRRRAGSAAGADVRARFPIASAPASIPAGRCRRW